MNMSSSSGRGAERRCSATSARRHNCHAAAVLRRPASSQPALGSMHGSAFSGVPPAPAWSRLAQRQRLHRPACAALPEEALQTVAAYPPRDFIVFVVTVVAATALVKFFKVLAMREVVDQSLSRKFVHIFSGPLYVLAWPLFSLDPDARVIAACVPTLNFMRLLLVGSGILEDQGLVKSVSRSGDKSELLKGPLYYCVVLSTVCLLCWRDTPAGIVTISLMCGGDGLADVVGRRFGSTKIPYNKSKSWAGSIAMFAGGSAMAIGLISVYSFLGFLPSYPGDQLLIYVCSVALLATIVESLPINQAVDDNISVPVVSLLLSTFLALQLKLTS